MSETIYNELSQIQGFDSLSDWTKDLFKKACSQQDSEKKTISISTYQSNNLYCDNSLDCPEFSKFLNFFDEVSIDISYTSKVFDP